MIYHSKGFESRSLPGGEGMGFMRYVCKNLTVGEERGFTLLFEIDVIWWAVVWSWNNGLLAGYTTYTILVLVYIYNTYVLSVFTSILLTVTGGSLCNK